VFVHIGCLQNRPLRELCLRVERFFFSSAAVGLPGFIVLSETSFVNVGNVLVDGLLCGLLRLNASGCTAKKSKEKSTLAASYMMGAPNPIL